MLRRRGIRSDDDGGVKHYGGEPGISSRQRQRLGSLLGALFGDIRYAFRSLSRKPIPAVAAIVALGIGVPGISWGRQPEPLALNTKEVRSPETGGIPSLVGTLTWPGEGCPCPTAILLQGAGSRDRDHTLLGKRAFALLADHLANQGIASLRFDGRRVGWSQGEPGVATAEEMAGDVLRWMAFLNDQPMVDGERLGVVGHSEAGMVGSLVASQKPDLSFLVMLGTPGVEYDLQYETSMARFDLRYDPASVLRDIRVPVLAVLGEKDVHVSPWGNREVLEAALSTGSGQDRVVVLPALSHFLQTAGTGFPEEYSTVEETIAPSALKLIALWIRTHTGPRKVASCTVIHAADGDVSLGASNEDYSDSLTHFWIIPPTAVANGWVKFGFAGGFPQAGMNDQGVFWDATGSPYLAMPESEATKTLFDGPLMVKVMEETASVDEARGIFGNFYCEDQYRAQYLVGDGGGASMIVEGDGILMKEGPTQVATNFYQSHPELGGYPCNRFSTATQMLADAEEITPFLLGKVLDATHQSGKYPTQYSIIYDLKNLLTYLFYYHNFHEYLVLDLNAEFQKGASDYAIPPIFSQIRLLSPAHEATTAGSSVRLRWEGNWHGTYQLCYGTTPVANAVCSAIQPQVAAGVMEGGLLLVGVSLCFLALGFPFQIVRGRGWVIYLGALLLATGFACRSDPTGPVVEVPEITEMTHDLTGLQPGTTYYWKLKATSVGGSGFVTETIPYSFTAGG